MTRTKFNSVQEYFKYFPPDIQKKLKLIRESIKSELPKEVVETISYQIPTFKLNGKYVIYYSAFTNHCSIYPIPKGPESFRKKIAPHVKGKGTLQFPHDKEIPTGLIKEITKYSLEANLNRAKSY